jgi:hypothetical protein
MSEKPMREQLLATLRHEPHDRIAYQPRITFWYYTNSLPDPLPPGPDGERIRAIHNAVDRTGAGVVPAEYRSKSLLDMYRDVGGAPRYATEGAHVSLFRLDIDQNKVRVNSRPEGEQWIVEYETPAGNLREVMRHGYHSEYMLKEPRDFAAYRHLLDATTFVFDDAGWSKASQVFGDDSIPQTFFPRTPLQKCFIEAMGFEPTIYALFEYPNEMRELMRAMADWDDHMYEALCACPAPILNFGENIDANMASPRLFKEHLLPYYERRAQQLRAAGKITHIHADGSLRGVLELLVACGFDGIEAATPEPQGDLTIAEIKAAMGDTVLLDGIPAICFLPHFRMEEFERITSEVIETFAPNLVLGISDELPPGGDITRVKLAGDMAAAYRA